MAVISGQRRQYVNEIKSGGVITETEMTQHISDYHVAVESSLTNLNNRAIKYDGQFGVVDNGTSRTTYQYNQSTDTWVEFSASQSISQPTSIDGGSPTDNPAATAFKIDFGSPT